MDQMQLFEDIAACDKFVNLVACGTPLQLAGFEVGWTPYRLQHHLNDEAFREIVVAAQDRSLDAIERKVHQLAMAGNMSAVQMVLYNKRPADWKDVKRIEVNQTNSIEVSIIDATKRAVLDLMRDVGPEALQIGTGFDRNSKAIETTAVALDED